MAMLKESWVRQARYDYQRFHLQLRDTGKASWNYCSVDLKVDLDTLTFEIDKNKVTVMELEGLLDLVEEFCELYPLSVGCDVFLMQLFLAGS